MKELIICFVAILSTLRVSSQIPHEEFCNGLSGTEIQISRKITVADQYLSNPMWAPEYIIKGSKVVVELKYDQVKSEVFPICTVEYKIDLYNQNNVLIKSQVSQSLILGANKDRAWVVYDEGSLIVDEYYKAEVTITNVNGPIPEDVHLDVRMEKDRSYKLSATALSSIFDEEQDNGIMLAWEFLPGAMSYDVEWLFFETNPNPLASSPEIDFSDAYRISTTFNHYVMPKEYSEGTIVFRVRARGSDNYDNDPTNVFEGDWSYIPTAGALLTNVPSSSRIEIDGTELQKNWIYTASYAEEGLRMDGMAFFDGAFKQRQSISSANTDGVKLVSETYYDFHNRPVIQTLPAAVQTQELAHINIFNPDYGPALYDDDNLVMDPAAVSSGSLLGYFYTDVTTGLASLNKYLPDANGYPYSRTVYTPDPSGRVSMNTMAGVEFKAGGEHESRYYYGTATQEELDRLFGNNVGDAVYYSKDMFRDANGQISISYKDLHGRVVATGIASLQNGSPYLEIDNAPEVETINEDLTNKNIINDENSSLIQSIPVSIPGGNYEFEYILTPNDLRYFCEANHTFIQRPYYFDLYFYVTDQYGGRLSLNKTSVDGIYDDFEKEIYVNAAREAIVSFNVDLPEIGTYYVHKIAVPNSVDIESYVAVESNIEDCVEDEYIVPDPCPSCCSEQCTLKYYKQIGPDTYVYVDDNGAIVSTEVGQGLIATCLENCEDEGGGFGTGARSLCEMQYETMKLDMSPGGQYFDNKIDEYIEDVNGLLIENVSYDINEFLEYQPYNIIDYLLDKSINVSDFDDLRANWQDSYGEYMVWFHPEYSAFYRHCVSLCTDVCFLSAKDIYGSSMWNSSLYDASMSSQTDDQTAYTTGYFFPVSDDVGTGLYPDNYTIDHQDYMYVSGMTGTYEVLADAGIMDTSCSLPYCTDIEFFEIIQRYLTKFVKLSTGEYFSIWYVMDDPAVIGSMPTNPWGSSNTEVYNLFVSLHNSTTGLLNTNSPNHISKIQFFSGVYNAYKQYVIYNNLDCDPNAACWGTNTWATYPDTCLGSPHEHFSANNYGLSIGNDIHVPAGYALHFPKDLLFEAMGCDCSGNPSLFNLTDLIENTQTETCEINCQNRLDVWKNKLSNCSLNSGYSFDADVAPALLFICENSCSAENAFLGGDLLPSGIFYNVPGTNPVVQLNSFQGVVNHFYASGCTAPQHPVYDCNWRCSCDMLNALIDGIEVSGTPTNQDIANRVNELTGETIYTEYDIASWRSSCGSLIYNQTDCDQMEANLLTPSGLNGIPDLLLCDNGNDMTWAEYIAQCISENAAAAQSLQNAIFEHNLEEYQQYILNEYNSRVLPAVDGYETFTMTYSLGEYAYTLYYYDQAGNLVQTVPPEGVDLLDATERTQVKDHREHPNNSTYPAKYPDHNMPSVYAYNSFQGIIKQTTPDGMTYNTQNAAYEVSPSTTNFYYDDNARIVASQNAKQAKHSTTPQFSFTKYDQFGRITNTGQVYSTTAPYNLTNEEYMTYSSYETWLNGNTSRDQIVYTQYDEPYSTTINGYFLGSGRQQNLRNRVASVFRDEDNDGNYDNAIHYSYDVHGNAKTVIRDIPGLEPLGKHLNRMEYTYDLISGNVLTMTFLSGQTGELTHKYSYDADNRLHRVYTKTAAGVWETDAKYFYYATGALARTETGDKQVQGTDYIYTINGWLRAVNSGELNAEFEPGHDAKVVTTNPNALFGTDVAGLTLGYYMPQSGNNELVNHSTDFEPSISNTYGFSDARKELFNGNIAWSVHAITKPDNNLLLNEAHIYRYDQLNRLKSDQLWQPETNHVANIWQPSVTTKYFSEYVYDFNGNILNLARKGDNLSAIEMDDLMYKYQTETMGTETKRSNNLLLSYNDMQSYASRYTNDLDGYGLTFNQADDGTWCFIYDEIGNLIQDQSNEISDIEWDVFGKIKSITRTHTSTQPDLEFIYDPMGNRIGKIEKPRGVTGSGTELTWKYTWYTLDAQGQTLATHFMDYVLVDATYQANYQTQEEYIFGSSRLGVLNTENTLPEKSRQFTFSGYDDDGRFIITQWATEQIGPTACAMHCDYPGSRTLGSKQYELTDHLGNVLATISDLKIYNATSGRFEAKVISCQDYFPFGMLMNNRQEFTTDYRFGFNGKENDNEVKGTGNQQDYGMRIYDPRLARFLSADPLIVKEQKYAWYSPYQFAGNKPIQAIDLDGLEEFIVTHFFSSSTKYSGSTILYVPSQYRRLGASGVLEVNKIDSKMAQLYKRYSQRVHDAEYFKEQNGTWVAKKGLYSQGSANDAVNNYCIKLRNDEAASIGAGFIGLFTGTHRIGMEYDDSKLTQSSINEANKTAAFLLANPDYFIQLDGSSSPENNTNDENYNTKLAQKRVDDFVGILEEKGVPESQYSASSSGTQRATDAGVTDKPEDESKWSFFRGVFITRTVKFNPSYGQNN